MSPNNPWANRTVFTKFFQKGEKLHKDVDGERFLCKYEITKVTGYFTGYMTAEKGMKKRENPDYIRYRRNKS